MNDLFKPHQCPRCFGLFKIGDKFWNDSGTIYHLMCWINKTKEDDELHAKAGEYASNRRDAYIAKMQKGEVKKHSKNILNWIWVAHYEGYKEGYWTAKGNDRFTTDPDKLKDKNT